MNSTLKIAAVSDLHGNLPELPEPAEILLLAGDIVPLNIQFNKLASKEWFEGPFAEWIKALPVESVFMVAGNHDAYFENISKTNLGLFKEATNFKLKYLKNTTLVHHSKDGIPVKIFGTPYCHRFGTWPFMRDEEYMEEKFKEIPDDVDIIISHDPPFALSDADVILEDLRQLGRGGVHLGNIPLGERIRCLDFKLLVCGHIHSGDHNLVNRIANVSYVNENYSGEYPIFYTEINLNYE